MPQFASSDVRLRHPVPQHALPALHVTPHAWQFVVSTATHALLQQSCPMQTAQAPPQCASVLATHAPAQQTSPDTQACPHVPQLSSSVIRSAQDEPQHV